jgi:capsular polysaccharide transport system permease protein
MKTKGCGGGRSIMRDSHKSVPGFGELSEHAVSPSGATPRTAKTTPDAVSPKSGKSDSGERTGPAPEGKIAPLPMRQPGGFAGKPGRKPKDGGRNRPALPLGGPDVAQGPRPVAPMARPKGRHWGLLVSMLLIVVLPIAVSSAYLWGIATDQYASTVGFAVRSEQPKSSLDVLGGLSQFTGGGSSSSDMNVLNSFIESQAMVEAVNSKIDLRAIWSPPHRHDPLFGLDPRAKIEDLVDYWQRMVIVSYDNTTGLMELTVKAFSPEDARRVAEAIFDESSTLTNRLSAIARKDATRYAKDDLEQAKERLKAAQTALTQFRTRTRVVDPSADIQGRMGVLTSLQQQLAQDLIGLETLRRTARPTDPRIAQEERRVDVIRGQIEKERERFGANGTGPGGENYARLVAQYAQLSADETFARTAYTTALASYDAAVADANHQSRYLAAYIRPTVAQQSEYPARFQLLAELAAFLLLGWSIGALVYYSVRDRR